MGFEGDLFSEFRRHQRAMRLNVVDVTPGKPQPGEGGKRQCAQKNETEGIHRETLPVDSKL
jgi:hypothetical protein